jgi:hypothetical protein
MQLICANSEFAVFNIIESDMFPPSALLALIRSDISPEEIFETVWKWA